MNKEEFNDWVEVINEKIKNDKTVLFNVLLNNIVIAYDTTKMKSAISKCGKGDVFDENVGKAIAYARLRDISVPKVEEGEPRFKRVGRGERYYLIKGVLAPCTSIQENGDDIDDMYFENNNYFHTEERAEEVLNKISFLLKLERLHDTYCPDYTPDFKNKDDFQYCVFYNYPNNKWEWAVGYNTETITDVYFPTGEIAEKVCDILNEENKKNE